MTVIVMSKDTTGRKVIKKTVTISIRRISIMVITGVPAIVSRLPAISTDIPRHHRRSIITTLRRHHQDVIITLHRHHHVSGTW
jgi:hypothetical protein